MQEPYSNRLAQLASLLRTQNASEMQELSNQITALALCELLDILDNHLMLLENDVRNIAKILSQASNDGKKN